MHGLRWLKSSFSDAGGNNCVEIAAPEDGTLALRESEHPAAILSTRRSSLGALVRGVKSGEIELSRP